MSHWMIDRWVTVGAIRSFKKVRGICSWNARDVKHRRTRWQLHRSSLQQRQCLIGSAHFVTVKRISDKSVIIYFPSLLFLRVHVSLCPVMDRSGRYSVKPRGAPPPSVSDESPGRWQGLLQGEKHRDIKNLKEIKEIDASLAGTRVKTCQWLYHL